MTIKNKLTGRFTLLAGAILILFSTTIFFVAKSYLINDFNLRVKDRLIFTGQLFIKNGILDKTVTGSIGNTALKTLLNEQIIILSESDSVWLNTFDENKNPFDQNLFFR